MLRQEQPNKDYIKKHPDSKAENVKSKEKKKKSVPNSKWLRITSETRQRKFPNLFLSKTFSFLIENATTEEQPPTKQKQTTATCTQEPPGPNHDVTINKVSLALIQIKCISPPGY